MHLRERRGAGAQRVGKPPHRIGDHQRDPGGGESGVEEGQLQPAEGAQVTDREHHAGNGERRGGGPVEQLAAGQARAQDDVGDGCSEDHVHQAREAAIEQGVADHARRLREHRLVVCERETLGQNAEAPDLRERHQQDAEVRREHQQEDPPDPAVREHRLPRREPALRERGAAALQRRVVAAFQDQRRPPECRHRENHHDHADHIADRVLDAHRSDAQVRLRRKHVGLPEDQRGTEVVEHLHEHERGAGDVAGHRERKDDPAEEPETRGAEVLRRFLHRAVDVLHRDGEVEEDEREVVQAFHEDHAVQALHERDGEAEVLVQQQVHRARAAEEELHRHRAHEGRHDERQHAEGLDQRRAAEAEAHREVGERNRDQRRHHDRHARDIEAVPERLAHERDPEERDDVREGEAAVSGGERRVDDARHRDDEKRQEENRDRERDRDDHLAAFASWTAFS